jgi:hypothetical protein
MLGLAQFSLKFEVDITTSKAILETIKGRAIAQWGEKKWLAALAQEYVKIVQTQGDAEATYENRRRQIYRVFEAYSCTLDTAIALTAAVGCRFQMTCTNVHIEVIDL